MATRYRDLDPRNAKSVEKYEDNNSYNINYATITAFHDVKP